MIPILFPADATDFSTNGLGRLAEAYQCRVAEERNGEYELSMKYPTSGKLFSEIQNESIIVAVPYYGATRQAFRVYNKKPDSKYQCIISARHISYDANYIPIKPFTAAGIQDTISKLNGGEYNLEANPFVIDTDIENETSPYTQNYPRSLRACLGGDEGSLLDVFASRGTGEYEWDNYNIHFWSHRGSDRGYECRYAKNIISLEREIDSENLVTGVVGMWQDPETEAYLYSDVQYADDKDTYKTNKTVVIDFSQDFDATPTPAELNAAAKIYADTQCMLDDSIDLEFYDQTNQNVKLCDTIKVKFDKIGVDLKVKVIKTVWDVLLERYESITIGSLRSTLADTLYDQMQNIAEVAARYTDKTITSVKVTIDDELGEINTSIETVSSNVRDLSSDINDQLNNEETGIIKLISDVDQKADSVSTTVSEIIEKGGILDQAISTSQQQFADSWELSTLKQAVSDNGQYIDEQQSYLRWDGEDGSVTIGKSDSNTKTRIDNEGYQVLVSGEVSWQADSEGSKNKKYMQAGRYKWVDEGDNGFSLIYV